MPQFELETDSDTPPRLVRARSAPDAVREALALPEHASVEVTPNPDVQGWSEVTVAGAPAGRVRPHQRMRFRRD